MPDNSGIFFLELRLSDGLLKDIVRFAAADRLINSQFVIEAVLVAVLAVTALEGDGEIFFEQRIENSQSRCNGSDYAQSDQNDFHYAGFLFFRFLKHIDKTPIHSYFLHGYDFRVFLYPNYNNTFLSMQEIV